MTAKPESIDEAERQQCLQYLLGELPDQQNAAFEQRLAESTPLCDELQQQSEMLLLLSETSTPQLQAVSQLPAVSTSGTENQSGNHWIEAIVALAACLLIAFVAWNASKETKTTASLEEDALIAEAWADTDVPNFAPLEIEAERDLDLEPQSYDESLSWVVTAIESGVLVDG